MLDLIRDLWQSAVQDSPKRPSCTVKDGNFVLTVTGNRAKWLEICDLSGVPSSATQVVDGDTLTITWPSVSDQLFAVTGPIAQRKNNYELRTQQLYVSRLVQRAIEMNDAACIEAGTGTGKSFAVLAPSLALNKKVVISTSNKALQAQYMEKDIPFLLEIFPGKKVALAQGKSNYACKAKCMDLGNVRLEGELAQWFSATETGNIESIDFPLQPAQRQAIAADDNCPGKNLCSFGDECFYYKEKAKRESADIVVTNHALLCLAQAHPGANILPQLDVIVIDEAHKLADYARNCLGVELAWMAVNKAIGIAESYDPECELDQMSAMFASALNRHVAQKTDPQISIEKSLEFDAGVALAQAMYDAADNIWELDTLPSDNYERKMKRDADKVRRCADKIMLFSRPTPEGYTRWLEAKDGALKMFTVPYDVSQFLSTFVGYETTETLLDHTKCARCGRTLTSNTVNILDGQPFGPDCITYVDVFGDAELMSLEEWLGGTHTVETKPARKHATIFTSATIAAPDMSMFMRECGIKGALTMQVESPFDYKSNALLYVPNGASPSPSDREWLHWMTEQIDALVNMSQGSAFLLFTSYNNMRYVRDMLEPSFRRNYPVYVQGDNLGKLEMAKRFAADGNGVLFGTKSFFEGVSIEGDALRLVTVDKMPFQAPHPLSTALKADLQRYAKDTLKLPAKDAEWYPFNHLDLPLMVIDLKQAFGRLIRTQKDHGVVAILDTRLRTAQYGRKTVLPSLPDAKLVAEPFVVSDFFYQRRQITPPSFPKITQRAPVAKPVVEDFTIAASKELAF